MLMICRIQALQELYAAMLSVQAVYVMAKVSSPGLGRNCLCCNECDYSKE